MNPRYKSARTEDPARYLFPIGSKKCEVRTSEHSLRLLPPTWAPWHRLLPDLSAPSHWRELSNLVVTPGEIILT